MTPCSCVARHLTRSRMAFSIGPAGAFVGDMGVQPVSCGSVMCVRLLRSERDGLAGRAIAREIVRAICMGAKSGWRTVRWMDWNVDDPDGLDGHSGTGRADRQPTADDAASATC